MTPTTTLNFPKLKPTTVSRVGQVMLVIVVVSVLMLMILPISPWLLDLFLALNMTAALMILMVSLSITTPMNLSSFPSILLICTLFRLGLNVSSTRLILSQGQAGKIIETFGYYVTGGNLAVGLIIFLVLLIIQFLVVSKGTERVAEVAARFTLDGLPGKQMSIDADLRAGMITSEVAAEQRSLLIKESKLYGSMDGAMKFVKGDTIAGFVVTFINIVGGLFIGVFDRGMGLSEAARWYSLLTIGDGLVSQIPALMVSLSAGILVTRVVDTRNPTSLGAEMGTQLLVNPSVLLLVAGLSVVLGLFPGFPTLLFLMIAVALCAGAGAVWMISYKKEQQQESISKHRLENSLSGTELGYAEPFLLELSPQLYHQFENDDRWQVCFNTLLPKLKDHLGKKYGIPYPDLKIVVDSQLAADRYVIKIYELPVDEGWLSPEHCVVSNADGASQITMEEAEREAMTHHGTPVKLLYLRRQQELEQQGHKVVAPEDMLLRHVGRVLKKHGADFIGIQEVRNILSEVEKHHPELLREVIPRMLTIHKFTEVLRRLVDEEVPIKDFRLILETLSGSQPDSKDAVDLAELMRLGLRRVITHEHTDEHNSLACFCLDPDVEQLVESHIQKNDGERYLTLEPQKIQEIVKAIELMYRSHDVFEKDVVLLTQVEIRRSLRKMIELDLPDVAVLSFQELDPRVKIDQRDTISLDYGDLVAL